MKVLLAVLFTLSGIAYAQITFEKYYDELDKILSFNQTSDAGYIVGTQTHAIAKLDKYGDIQWIKRLPSYNAISHDVIEADDSTFIVVTTDIGESKDIYLYKLSLDGELIWNKRFGTPDDDFGYYVRQMPDKGFMIFGTKFIRTDKDGNLLWQKSSPVIFGVSNSVKISQNGNIIISTNGKLSYLNPEGELLWLKNIKLGSSTFIELQNHIFYAGSSGLFKIDLKGNILESRPVKYLFAIAEYNDNAFMLANKDSLIKMSSDFSVVWSKRLNANTLPSSIKKVQDGYLLTGNNGWLLKTDSEGDYKSLLILKPANREGIKPMEYKIKWSSSGVRYINLEYSINNGNTWNEIASNLSDTGAAQWKVPVENGDYILRILDAADPDTRDYAGPFPVTWNNNNDYIAVNQILMWVGNNGMGSHVISDGEIKNLPGLYWPGGRNGNITAVYRDGLLWGGKVNGIVSVNGSTYRDGLVPGKILDNGSPDDRYSYKYKIWKINKNWEALSQGAEKDKLKTNFLSWPGELGAPYRDVNSDGTFTNGIDQPEFAGDETLWFIANDLDSTVTRFVYGSDPIGLEVQTTIYAYNIPGDLADVVFKKYKLINKSENTIEDMRLAYWSDPDIGDANDDFAGCDSILHMSYCYNGDNNDQGYYGANPPAVGYKMVQGPVTESPGDSACYDNRIVKDKINLKSGAFSVFMQGSNAWTDPMLGSINGAEQIYYYMQGRLWDGSSIINPVSGQVTKFPFAGDPVSRTGWYEGAGWPGGKDPDDRRMMISTQSFNFAPLDTQEVVFAIILARGESNLGSITELKRKAKFVQEYYNQTILTNLEEKIHVSHYSLQQNYPNPFNPATTIRYSLAEKTFVEISVYDILGKKVTTLVNEEKPAGEYVIQFNAHNLASGVYYYRMKTNEYLSTRKMLLIK